MTIRYEINPPRTDASDIDEKMAEQMSRIDKICGLCDGVHVTDSVLGTNRVPAIEVAERIKARHRTLQVTISVRVRDKDMQQITDIACRMHRSNMDGMLILKGDPSGRPESGLIPSAVASELIKSGVAKREEIYLSLPSRPDFAKIKAKISANPKGFVTQVIRSKGEVDRLCSHLNPLGFKIMPCILLPSEKNAASAKTLGLDWSAYGNNTAGFVSDIADAAGDVLITSPNDFGLALETLYSTKYSALG